MLNTAWTGPACQISTNIRKLLWLNKQNKYSGRSQTFIFSKSKPVKVFTGQKVSVKDCTGNKMYFERRDIYEECKTCPKRWKETWKKTPFDWHTNTWKKEMEYLRVKNPFWDNFNKNIWETLRMHKGKWQEKECSSMKLFTGWSGVLNLEKSQLQFFAPSDFIT